MPSARPLRRPPGLTARTLGRALGPGRVVPGVGRQRLTGDGRVETEADGGQFCLGQYLAAAGRARGVKQKSSSSPYQGAHILLPLAVSLAITMTTRDALMGPRASRLCD